MVTSVTRRSTPSSLVMLSSLAGTRLREATGGQSNRFSLRRPVIAEELVVLAGNFLGAPRVLVLEEFPPRKVLVELRLRVPESLLDVLTDDPPCGLARDLTRTIVFDGLASHVRHLAANSLEVILRIRGDLRSEEPPLALLRQQFGGPPCREV